MKSEAKKPVWLGVAAAVVVGAMTAIAGCQVDDLIKFQTPAGVQRSIDVEEWVPVSKAETVFDEWQKFVELNTTRMQGAVEDGRERVALVASITDMGVQAASGPLSTVPGGAILVGALSMAAGIFVKRPGDKKREEEAIKKAVEEAVAP